MGSVSDTNYVKRLDWCSGRKWLDFPGPSFSLYPSPRGKWSQGYWKLHSRACHQPALHPFHHKAFCTSWLLPETIRSPLVPSVLLPGMSSPSPNTTAAFGQRKVMNQNFIPFSFARSSLLSQIWISHQIWSRTTHFWGDTVHILTIQIVFTYVYACEHVCMRALLL